MTRSTLEVTLADALHDYLRIDRAEQTRDTYRKFLSRFIAAIGPERPIDLVDADDIDAYVTRMRKQKTKYTHHTRRPEVKAPLSKTTIYKNVKMIKGFFRWCERQGIIAESPAGYLVNRRPERPLGQGKAATDREVLRLLEAARFKTRDRALLLFLALSGARAGEAASLRICDLNLADTSAYVNGKGNKRRRVYFDWATSEAIAQWLDERPLTSHDYVFTSGRGHGQLTPRAVSEIIRRLSRTAGLPKLLGSHSLRHRVGLTFARKRVAPRVAQHYLGHSNITTTLEYYQDVDESDLRAAGDLLSLSLG